MRKSRFSEVYRPAHQICQKPLLRSERRIKQLVDAGAAEAESSIQQAGSRAVLLRSEPKCMLAFSNLACLQSTAKDSCPMHEVSVLCDLQTYKMLCKLILSQVHTKLQCSSQTSSLCTLTLTAGSCHRIPCIALMSQRCQKPRVARSIMMKLNFKQS